MHTIYGPGNIPHKKTIPEHIAYMKVKCAYIVKTHTYKIKMCHYNTY